MLYCLMAVAALLFGSAHGQALDLFDADRMQGGRVRARGDARLLVSFVAEQLSQTLRVPRDAGVRRGH